MVIRIRYGIHHIRYGIICVRAHTLTLTKVVKIKKSAKMFGAFPEKHYLCTRKLILYG